MHNDELDAAPRGIPRTADEWTALMKISGGERGVPASKRKRLVALGRVVIAAGIPALTRRGRLLLGLPD